jgi:murein DD-endopeptidase MepM/ murein hydrolase activator NlpD
MKRIILTVTLSLCMTMVFAQTEMPTYRNVAMNFEKFYNSEKYDSIFFMFSKEMQSAVPLDKTKEFLTNLHLQAGKIQKTEFVKYESTYAVYKTQFDKTVFALNFSLDSVTKINGLFVNAFKDETLPKIDRNKTKMYLPFKEEWTVIWGGDTKELNYHVESNAQKNAFDIVITDKKGKSYKTNGKTNEDFYAFGKQLFAPCDGQVVFVQDGVKENKPGELNPAYVGGNMVIIKTSNNEFVVFCHFKNGSVLVKEGQQIKRGQLLGHCGNSGQSSEPHLHFHLQNGIDMNTATGIKCYFDKVIVNGKLVKDYSPIQKEKIRQ